MKIEHERGESKTIEFDGTVKELLVILEENPEAVLVTRDKQVLTEDQKVTNDDTIKILSVISGG